jgi:hypothetical protein
VKNMSLIHIIELVQKYYEMKDGEKIENHQSFFVVYEDEIEVRVKYRTIKHIVESRKRDFYKIQEIIALFERMFDVFQTGSYTISNSKENNSYLLIENNVKYKALVIALDINIENDSIHIKTSFFRAVTKTIK